MSIVAVRKYPKTIEFASDTQTTWGHNKEGMKKEYNDKQISSYGKVFQVNDMTLGCAGSVTDISLLQIFSKTHKPKVADRDSILEWLIEFKEWAVKKGADKDIRIHAIMVYEGKIFSFYDFLLVEEIEEFWAVGSGMFLAVGAMEIGATAESAVKVASKYDLYCGGKVRKLRIPR